MTEIKDCKYLIIGAGPVGLYMAIQLLEKQKEFGIDENNKVYIIEKRGGFTREQIVMFSNAQTRNKNYTYTNGKVLKYIKDLDNKCFTLLPAFDKKRYCRKSDNGLRTSKLDIISYGTIYTVTINDLQQSLLNYVQEPTFNNGNFVYLNNTEIFLNGGNHEFKNTQTEKYIILKSGSNRIKCNFGYLFGCEGYNSIVRDKILKLPVYQKDSGLTGYIFLLKDNSSTSNTNPSIKDKYSDNNNNVKEYKSNFDTYRTNPFLHIEFLEIKTKIYILD